MIDMEDTLLNFSPEWRKQLENLLCERKLVIALTPINIIPHIHGNKENHFLYSNHFELEIPFSGVSLKWEVFLDENNYCFAPDFDFNSDTFLKDPSLDTIMEHIPSLLNWDIANPKMFTRVIQEFLKLYKQTQLYILNTDEKVKSICDEYDLSLTDNEILDNKLEISASMQSINIFVDLSINVDSLSSEESIYLHPDLHKAILQLKTSGKKLIPSLHLSAPLEEILGKSSTLMIPSLKKKTALLEYVNTVKQMINDTLNIIQNKIKYRNEYISNLLSELTLDVVEYDSESFTNGTFRLVDSELPCFIHIVLPNKFPFDKPNVYIRSSMYERNNKPCFDILDDCPFSPRWDVSEMVKRLISYLPNAIKSFQEYCIKNSIDY